MYTMRHSDPLSSTSLLSDSRRRAPSVDHMQPRSSSLNMQRTNNTQMNNTRRSNSFVARQTTGMRGQSPFQSYHCPPSASSSRGLHHGPYKPPADEPLLRAAGRSSSCSSNHFGRQKSAASLAVTVNDEGGLADAVRWGLDVAAMLSADIALYRKKVGGGEAMGISKDLSVFYSGVEGASGGMGDSYFGLGRDDKIDTESSGTAGYPFLFSSHVPFAESGAAQRRALLTVGNASARTRNARCSTSEAVGGSWTAVSAPTVTASTSTSNAFRHPIITPSERATFDEDLMRLNYHRQETLFFSTVLPAAQALARSRRETYGDGSGTNGPLDASGNNEEQRRAKKKKRASRRLQESDQATHSPKPHNPNPNHTNNTSNNGLSWAETVLSPLTPAARRQMEEDGEAEEPEERALALDPTRTPTRSSSSSSSSEEDVDYDSNTDSVFLDTSSTSSSSLSSSSSMTSPHKDHDDIPLAIVSPRSVAVSHVDSVLASLHPIHNGGGVASNKAVDTKGSIGFIPSANVLFTPSPCPLRAVLYEAHPMPVSSRHTRMNSTNTFTNPHKEGTASHHYHQQRQSINDTASFHVMTTSGTKSGGQIETGRGSSAAAQPSSSSAGGHTSSSFVLNSAAVSPIPKFAHTAAASRQSPQQDRPPKISLHSQQEWDTSSSANKSYWSSRSHAVVGNSAFWDASTSLASATAGGGGAPRPVATSYATVVTINDGRRDDAKHSSSLAAAAAVSNSIEEELSYSDLHTHRLLHEGSSAQQKRAMARVSDGSLLSPPPPLPSAPTPTSISSTPFGGKSVSIMNASVVSAQQHRAKRDRADVQNSRRIVAMAENGVDHMATLVLRGCGDAIGGGLLLLDFSGGSSSLLNKMPTPTLAALRACPTEIFVRYFFHRMNLAPLLGLSEQFRRVASEGTRMGGTSLLEEGGHPIFNGQCVWQMLQIVHRSLQESLLRILEACEKEEEEAYKENESTRQSSVRQRLEVLYRVLFADEVEAHFAPSFGDLWRKANTATSTAAARGGSGSAGLAHQLKQRPPPLSLLQKHRLVLAHISTGAAVIARAVPSSKARRMAAELKRVATGSSSSSSLQSAADRESGDSNTLAKMWGVVADLLAVFFIILLPSSPPALAEGQHMRGGKGRSQREGGHTSHLVGIQTIGLEQLSLLPPPQSADLPHSTGAATATAATSSAFSTSSSYPSLSSRTVTPSYLSVFPSADYYTYDEIKVLDAALCRFLMELQVLPEPSVVPSLRPLLQNAIGDSGSGASSGAHQILVNNSANTNGSFTRKGEAFGGSGGDLAASTLSSSSQVIIDSTIDPLAAPFIPESLAYGGLSSAAAYRASYGSLTPGVTGHIVGAAGKESSRGNSYFTEDGDGVGHRGYTTAATSLRQSVGFTPRSTPLFTVLDPTVFPYLRNGTLLCDIAAKLIGDVAGGSDLLLNFSSASVLGGSSTGGRGDVGGFATAPENRLTTVQSKQKTTNEGAAGAYGSTSRPPLRSSSSPAVSSSSLSWSLSSFTRNPRVEKACLVNINLALKLLSSTLSKGSVAKRLAMAGGVGGINVTSSGTVRGMCSDSAFLGGEGGGRGVSKGLGLFSLSAVSKSLNSSLNPSRDAGLGVSGVPSSSATALSLSSSGTSYLAPYCLHDAVRIFEGDVHFIVGLLEDLMRYAFDESPRGVVQQKGGGPARARADGGGGPFIPYRLFRDGGGGGGGRGVSVLGGVYSSGIANTSLSFPPHVLSSLYHSPRGENGTYSRSTATNGRQSTTNKTVLNSHQQWHQQEHSQDHAAHNTNALKRGAASKSSGESSELRGTEGGGTTTPMMKRETQQRGHTVSPARARANGGSSGEMSPPSSGATKRGISNQSGNNESTADTSNTDHATQTSFLQTQQQQQQQHSGDHSRRGGNVIDLKANPHMSYLAAVPPTSDEECAELGAWLARKLGPRYTHTAHDGSFSVDFGQCLGLSESGAGASGSGSGARSIVLSPSWFVGGTCHLGGTVMLATNNTASATAIATATNQRGVGAGGGGGGQTPSKERGQGKCWLFSDGVVLYDLAKVLVYNNSTKLRGPLLGSVSTKVSAPAAKKHNIRLVLRFLAEEKRLGVGKHGVGIGLSGDGGAGEVDAGGGGGPYQSSSAVLLRLLSKTSASIANAPSLEDALVAGDLRAVVMVLREVRWAFRTHVEGGPAPSGNTNASYSNRSSSTSSAAIMGHTRGVRSGSVSTAAGDGRPSSQTQQKSGSSSNGGSIVLGLSGVAVPNTMPRAQRRGSSQSFSSSQIEASASSLRRERSSSAVVPLHKSIGERGTPSHQQRQQPQLDHKARVVASGHSFSSASSPLSHNTNKSTAKSSSATKNTKTNKISGTTKASPTTMTTSATVGPTSSSTAAERVVAMAARASSLLLGLDSSSQNINHHNQKESESKQYHSSSLQTPEKMRQAENSHRNEEGSTSRGRNANLENLDADEEGGEEDDGNDDAMTSSSSSFFVRSNNNTNSAVSLSVVQAFASLESHRFTTPVQELIGLGLGGGGGERDGGVGEEDSAQKTSSPHTNAKKANPNEHVTSHGRRSERRSASDAMGPPLDFFVPVGDRHGRRGSESAPYGEIGIREGGVHNAFPLSNSQHLEFEVRPPSYPSGLSTPLRTWM